MKEYFKTTWKITEIDPDVVKSVSIANNVLDVGCGHNQYKEHAKNAFWGVDLVCEEADELIDIIDFNNLVLDNKDIILKEYEELLSDPKKQINRLIKYLQKFIKRVELF